MSKNNSQTIVSKINRLLSQNAGIQIRKIGAPFITKDEAQRFLYFAKRFNDVRDIEGDIVECGVGSGRDLLSWYLLVRDVGPERRIYACDTFSGFPSIHEKDGNEHGYGKGALATSTAEVRRYFSRAGLNDEEIDQIVEFVVGDVSVTLGPLRETLSQIAILHLDLDLYAGYKTALEALHDRVVPGGLVMFDEYINTRKKYPGAEIAINEFFGERAKDILYDDRMNRYYLVKQ